jgi:hypothetical protein
MRRDAMLPDTTEREGKLETSLKTSSSIHNPQFTIHD